MSLWFSLFVVHVNILNTFHSISMDQSTGIVCLSGYSSIRNIETVGGGLVEWMILPFLVC